MTSKKCAADAEKEINMDEKEVTLVEDIEVVLPPAEPNRTTERVDMNSLMEFLRRWERK